MFVLGDVSTELITTISSHLDGLVGSRCPEGFRSTASCHFETRKHRSLTFVLGRRWGTVCTLNIVRPDPSDVFVLGDVAGVLIWVESSS